MAGLMSKWSKGLKERQGAPLKIYKVDEVPGFCNRKTVLA